MRVRRKQIENLAEEVLRKAEIENAPILLNKIARYYNLEITRQDGDDSISGMLINTGSGSAIIGINRNHHPNRQRFTLAHEIGHFLLHKFDGIHFDGKNTGLQINFRDSVSSTGEDVLEKEANLFAAELLMPRKFLEEDMANISLDLLDKDDKTIKNLATKYKVSVRAMTFRLSNLGYLDI